MSYRQSDGTATAVALAWALRAAGVPVWHDRTDLPPGDTETRLKEALAAGLSGALLLVTPELESSVVVRTVELPRLLELARQGGFTLALASTVHRAAGDGLDYEAPDRLLEQKPGTLSGFDQQPVSTAAERGRLAARICRQRMELLHSDVASKGGVLTMDVQTRIPPFAAGSDAHLVLRLRPPVDGQRRPNADGLEDLRHFLGELPQLLAIAGATSLHVRGGAHLAVACALGAAVPTTLIGEVSVEDTQGAVWTTDGQVPQGAAALLEDVWAGSPQQAAGPVLVYVDLVPNRNDPPFDYLASGGAFAGVAHLRTRTGGLLSAADTGAVVGEVSAAIRALAGENETIEVHLLLRTPYPVALHLGRTLNTLTVHVYEWEDAPVPEERLRWWQRLSRRRAAASTNRAVPSLVLRSGTGGSPIHSVTAPRADRTT